MPVIHFLVLFFTLLLLSLPSVDGKRDMAIVDQIEGPTGAEKFQSAVIDAQNSAAYLGTATQPGRVCKYKISSTNFSFVSCITAPSNMDNFATAVIDTQNSAAYFGAGNPSYPGRVCKFNIAPDDFSLVSCITAPSGVTRTAYFSAVVDTQNSVAYFASANPSQVCKYNISSADFSLVSCVAAPYVSYGFYSAVIDTQNSAAYFGTGDSPGEVCKFTVSSTDFSLVSCIAAPYQKDRFNTAVIDVQNSAAYFGADTSPGEVCQYNISSANFAFVKCIASSTARFFRSAVIDTHNSVAYFGARNPSSPGQVCKYNIAPGSFSFVSCIIAPVGVESFFTGVIDTPSAVAYFGTNTVPGQLCKYRISPLDFSLLSCIAAPSGASFFSSAVINAQNTAAYFSTSSSPGRVCKYDISSMDFSFNACIAAPSSVNGFLSAVIDSQNSAAYFGARTPSPYSGAPTPDGQVCKYSTDPDDFSFVSCTTAPSGATLLATAVVDVINHAAYFGTDTSPGRICKLDISPGQFSFDSCITAPSTINSFTSAVIDTQNSAAYFGTDPLNQLGRVCKINISSANFSLVSCITAPSGSGSFRSSVVDTQNAAAYFGTSTGSAKLCKFNISSANFSLVSCITASGANYFRSAVIDTRSSAAYLGTYDISGASKVCKFNIAPDDFSFVSCTTTAPGVIRFSAAVIDTQNSIAYFGTGTDPGDIIKVDLNAFGCNSDGHLSINQDDFASPSNNTVKFTALIGCSVTMSSVSVDQPITFLQSIGSSTITLRNITSASKDSFVHLALSTPFSSSSSITLEDNQFEGNRLLSSPSGVNLLFSTWVFKCNKWVNGYNNAFKTFMISQNAAADQLVLECPQTHTVSLSLTQSESDSESWTRSPTPSHTTSLSTSTTHSLSKSQSRTKELTFSESSSYSTSPSETSSTSLSASESISNSASTSLSESIYCFNLNQQQCSDVAVGNCHFCSNRNLCVPREQDCNCAPLEESLCPLATGCKYCSNANVCVQDEIDCECYVFEETACKLATSTCRWCSNFNSCLSLLEECYCSTLSQYACTSLSDHKCTYCADQDICLPTTDFTRDTCSCVNMNSSNCQRSKCSWCDNYQTCSTVPSWDCDCTSLSNTSASSCSTNSNNHCKLCQDESVCVDAKKFTCRCENFTQSVCGSTNSCRWCDTLNSCTLPENKNCTCNWLRFEDSCNRNSNNKCSWCATSSDTGTAKHNSPIPNFNYCINKDGKDQCQCSFLSPSVCSIANDPSLNQNKNLSTSCRYCPNAGICAHPGNDQCECGNFEQHACGTAAVCSWKDPVLTSDGATQYCSAASVMCSPVMCEGILTQSSCDASGCSWNFGTSRCGSNSACFNFFVAGFTPQPMLLWVIGLLKDVLVVFLVGAYANTFTRPIMKFVTAVKKKVLKQTHIKQQMMDETVYICDKHCRDDLPVSFPQYVERVLESVFELENDDLLDEKNRRVLFDAVAYTLFDNMIWVDIDLLQKKDNDEEINFNKKFGLGDKQGHGLSQHEMKDLTVEKVDVKDDEGNDDEQQKQTRLSVKNTDDEKNDDALTMEELVENFTANVLSKLKNIGVTRDADVNARAQFFGRFIAAATTQYDTYLKTKNVDLLKIKVFLTAQDFESAVTLTKKVDEALIERASAYVFYDQSRSRKVCAAASANTFPPALSLIYYSLALLFLFISSMITVSLFKNFKRMVQSCDALTPLVSNNASDSSNITTTTLAPGSNDETVIDGSYITGAYFLLGFRLLNSSAFSTAILVFVKVIRGVYQRYSGIYTLSLQERIPLMALYSDRFIHVMLFLYALLVLPFAICGPTYGSSFGVYCWVPIFIAAAILIGDALVLYVSRRLSSLKNRLLKGDEAANDEKQQALSKTFGDLNQNFEDFLDSSPSKMNLGAEKSVAVPSAAPSAKAEVEKEEKRSETSENLKENLLSYTPREGEHRTEEEANSNQQVAEGNRSEEEAQLDEEVIKKQSSIESTSPVNLWNALLVFIMTEEIPVIVISLALQLSFNYAALLHYDDAFGLSNNYGGVYDRDYDSRSLSCIVSMFDNDVSSFVSGLSSFVPFM